MGNIDKRKERAKQKAKQVRLKKQKEREKVNNPTIVRVSPELLQLFETLPPPSPDYDSAPELRDYFETNATESTSDIKMSVAIAYVMYGHWFTSGSDVIARSELLSLAQQIVESEKFLNKISL